MTSELLMKLVRMIPELSEQVEDDRHLLRKLECRPIRMPGGLFSQAVEQVEIDGRKEAFWTPSEGRSWKAEYDTMQELQDRLDILEPVLDYAQSLKDGLILADEDGFVERYLSGRLERGEFVRPDHIFRDRVKKYLKK